MRLRTASLCREGKRKIRVALGWRGGGGKGRLNRWNGCELESDG